MCINANEIYGIFIIFLLTNRKQLIETLILTK